MNLTLQVPMQYCSLQHRTLHLSPVTSTAGYCFCLGSIPWFFLELFVHWSPVAYCTYRPGEFLFQYPIILPFHDYTMKMTNRFKGLALVDRVLGELWMEVHNTVQEAVTKIIPPKKERQEGKLVVWRGFKNSCGKKRSERQWKKGVTYQIECRVPKNSKER